MESKPLSEGLRYRDGFVSSPRSPLALQVWAFSHHFFKEMPIVQIVTFIGSLATVFSGYAARIPEEGKGSLFETYSRLVEGRFEAGQLLQEIAIYLKIGVKEEHEVQLRKLIGDGNALCQKLNSLQTTLLGAAGVED
jgi:hypothetical protein